MKPALLVSAAVLFSAPALVSAHLGVALPAYTRLVLPNGTVIYLAPRHEIPLVHIHAVVRGGAESDPPALGGLSSAVADLLRHGTETRSAATFSRDMDAIGATFNSWADSQSTGVSIELLSRYAERGVDLLAGAVLAPQFPAPEVRLKLGQSIDDALATKDSPGLAAALYFRALLFGPGHPYGHPVGGDELSLGRIARADIVAYHRRMYVGRNLILIAVGDFDPSRMRGQLVRALGNLRPGQKYEWTSGHASERPAGPSVLLVDQPGAPQTHFVIGRSGISRDGPDRLAVWLANTAFGGSFTSILNTALRIRSGLTYGANCVLDQNRLPGAISIRSFTATGFTAQAIQLALSALHTFSQVGISSDQLTAAKTYLKGNFPSDNLETSDELAATLSELELYGLGADDVNSLFSRIDAVTQDQVNAAARKYFGTSGLYFVLVGDAARLRHIAEHYTEKPLEISLFRPGYQIFNGNEPDPNSSLSWLGTVVKPDTKAR